MAPVTTITGTVSLRFNEIYNYLLHASIHPPVYKTEYQINLALIHARFYSAESDDERYEKSAAVNAFNRYCGGGGSSSL